MKRSLALATALLAGLGVHAVDSGCIGCHTNPASIKALFNPPPAVDTEAEG